MLHGRPDDPDPIIAGWLAGNTASRRNTTSPADVLTHWDRASPALQAALAKPLATQMDTFYQLRYRAVAGPARIPDPARAQEHAAVLPSLMWPGWALRLMPPGDYDFLRYRAALAVMLAVAVTGAEDYRTAQELLGLDPFHSSRLATFTARLRQDGILEPVTAAICQLARKLDEHGAPVDYARRRRLRRFSQAQLDTDSWRRQRYFLTHPATWAQHRHLDHATLPAAPVQEQLARLRLIELLTGTHPRYLPGPLRLPERRSQDYAEFVFTMPGQMARCLQQQARALLAHAGVHEPVTWEPPFDWAAGYPPGPGRIPTPSAPKSCTRSSAPGCPSAPSPPGSPPAPTTFRLAAECHPAPHLPAGIPAPPPAEPEPPGTDQLRDLTSQGYGPRKIARITGCSERAIRQLLTSAGLRQPGPAPAAASTRTGSARSTRTASAASRTSPPRPASLSEPSLPQPATPASASGTASPAAPTPRCSRRAQRVHTGRLERIQPPGRGAAHPKTPGDPGAVQPPARRTPARHQARPPRRPGPPARGRRRHRTPAHRTRRAAHADCLRPDLRRDVTPVLESLARSRSQATRHTP